MFDGDLYCFWLVIVVKVVLSFIFANDSTWDDILFLVCNRSYLWTIAFHFIFGVLLFVFANDCTYFISGVQLFIFVNDCIVFLECYHSYLQTIAFYFWCAIVCICERLHLFYFWSTIIHICEWLHFFLFVQINGQRACLSGSGLRDHTKTL